MTTPMDGRSTHLRGRGNSSIGGMTTQSASGSGSGLSGGAGSAGSRGAGRSATGGTTGSAGGVVGRQGGATSGRAISDLAKKLSDVEARLSLMEMGARAGQISFTSLLDGDLRAFNLLGELKMKIGKQSDGKFGVSYHNGVAPATPTTPLVSARQLYFVVGWDGEFLDGMTKPSDFARVDVHLSLEGPDFIPTGLTSVGSIYAEGNVAIPADIQDFYVRLVAVTIADVPSAPSPAVAVRPLPATAIAAESIAAVHLASEISLSSTFIAGDPSGAHLEMNASGIAMFRTDQTPTVMFSTEEGNALITGSIQTALASSGKSRIVFNVFPELDWNEIRFFAPGDKSWSSLFASRDREGKDGAIALQGFMTANKPFVMATVLGQDSVLTGVFNRDITTPNGQSPFSDGMLASPAQTLMIGGGGPSLIHNYKRVTPQSSAAAGTYDPFIAFIDNADAIVNGTSVLEFHEYYQASPQSPSAGNRRMAMRNLGTDLAIDWGIGENYSFGFKDYDLQQFVPIYFDGTKSASGRDIKQDIEPLADHADPLSVITGVEPKRYRRKGPVQESYDDTVWAPDIHPENLDKIDNPTVVDEVQEARRHKREDGKIPVGKRGMRQFDPEYGLIAEDVRDVAPEVVEVAPNGQLMLNDQSIRGLMWGGIRDLAGRVAELESRLNATNGES